MAFLMSPERRFLPSMGRGCVERLTKNWKRALERSRNWVENLADGG